MAIIHKINIINIIQHFLEAAPAILNSIIYEFKQKKLNVPYECSIQCVFATYQLILNCNVSRVQLIYKIMKSII